MGEDENNGIDLYSLGLTVISMTLIFVFVFLSDINEFIEQRITVNETKSSYGYFIQEREIEEKIESLAKIESTINQKKSAAIKLRNEYAKEIQQLEKELVKDKMQKSLSTFDQASSNSEVMRKIGAIQYKKAYEIKLNEIIPQLEEAALDLKYLQIKGRDDLRIINVLGQDQIKALIKEIDVVIDKHGLVSEELQINIDVKKLPSAKEIWNNVK